jgi:hypothetical protein
MNGGFGDFEALAELCAPVASTEGSMRQALRGNAKAAGPTR